MPRIDPQQLLVCLTPLLASNGGIKSTGEVIRLANLMEKYSKKLVSKCIYIQILKCTETDLIGQFMSAGGWNLTHNWLRDGAESNNWPFVQELLEMLLLCPVDGNRLKSNHTPKIVKNLSISCPHNSVRILSTKLVEQWLKIAHQEKHQLQQQTVVMPNGLNGNVNHINSNIVDCNKLSLDDTPSVQNINNINNHNNNNVKELSSALNVIAENGTVSELKLEDESSKKTSSENVKYKISNKEGSGGLLLSLKRSTSPIVDEKEAKISKQLDSKSKSSSSDKDKSKRSSSSSHKSGSSSSKSSHKERSSSSSSHHKSSSSSSKRSSSSSSSKSKDKSSSSSKHSSGNSSSSSRDKDKEREKRKKLEAEKVSQAEKDKETLNLLAPLPTTKLPKIAKRQLSENSENKSSESNKDSSETSPKIAKKSSEPIEKKKPSISIEVRKGEKPKTVKTLNSQFRNHGLSEEPPPPPSRKALKKPSQGPTPGSLPSSLPSSSLLKSLSPPPSKKLYFEKALETDSIQERVGGVKLMKPKPMLVESTGFLDALSASTHIVKKEVKKRKRLTSNSSSKKDEPESPKTETKPLKFYKDTLEEPEEDETIKNGEKSPTKELDSIIDDKEIKRESKEIDVESPEHIKDEKSLMNPKSPNIDVQLDASEIDMLLERRPGLGCGPDGPPGVLIDPNHPRRKHAKRSIRWRSDEELTEIRYFELDETERTNVSKPSFSEQKLMERSEERSAFLLGRKLQNDDTMVEQTLWRVLIIVDDVPHIDYGSKSREAEIQAERERTVLQELYLNRHSLIDSPHEPDTENYDFIEPAIIPLDDLTGNPDAVNNFTDISWPAPKGGESASPFLSNAFANVFPTLNVGQQQTPMLGLSTTANQIVGNPLANFPISGIVSSSLQAPGLINQWSIPPVAFMQPPPSMVQPQNNYNRNISTNVNNSFRNNRSGYSANTGGGGSWVRGNARRGICNQFQRTGFCRNGNNCVYAHER